MIDERAAQRVEQWVDEAVTSGAQVLAGGTRAGSTLAPTLVGDVVAGMKVRDEEVFGPVVTLQAFSTLDEAFAEERLALRAAGRRVHPRPRGLLRSPCRSRSGRVVIGDVPTYRADQMPYGGTKESGRGREGVAAAMTDLTYERVLVLSGVQV